MTLQVNQAPQVETADYTPRYTVNARFKEDLLKALGNRPFNELAGIMNAISVPEIDHNTLTQVINVLGQFPYIQIAPVLTSMNTYVTQIIPED